MEDVGTDVGDQGLGYGGAVATEFVLDLVHRDVGILKEQHLDPRLLIGSHGARRSTHLTILSHLFLTAPKPLKNGRF